MNTKTNTKQPTALITGASSGIGRATAQAFHEAGWQVYAGARRPESLDELQRAGFQALSLDVTDEDSMQNAVRLVAEQQRGLDVLVNNAGYGELGPLEEIPPQALRRQFETNVFGLLRVTQLVLPLMRQQRRGRIINISSMGGEMAFPGAGSYHATKYAVEALTDVLRVELRSFGVQVVCVQPGLVGSSYLQATLQTLPPDGEGQSYSAFKKNLSKGVSEMMKPNARGLLRSEDVARVILRAASVSRPRTRYKVGIAAQVLPRLRHKTPDRLWDAMTARMFPMT